jgi:hypothetical protein
MGRESNKKRRADNAMTARERAAAARAEVQRLEQRRRAMAILSTVVVIAIAAAVVAGIWVNRSGKSGPATVASDSVLGKITSVPASVRETIGAGDALSTGVPQTIQGTSLTANGKPTLLFIGAEFCPYCAAERWALIESLSRFGTFSGLQQIKSQEDSVSTFTFLHATYTSKYLNFDSKEQADQNGKLLQPLDSVENAQWHKYPGIHGIGYPFLDFNGQYVSVYPLVDPTVLLGKTWTEIADAMADPTSPIARAEVGAANYITATICKLTSNQPASACPASIQALASNYQPYKA